MKKREKKRKKKEGKTTKKKVKKTKLGISSHLVPVVYVGVPCPCLCAVTGGCT